MWIPCLINRNRSMISATALWVHEIENQSVDDNYFSHVHCALHDQHARQEDCHDRLQCASSLIPEHRTSYLFGIGICTKSLYKDVPG